MADTTAQHMAARDDKDLAARLIAAAEQNGDIPNPESFVRSNIGRIISRDIGDGVTLTAVHAYAKTVYDDAVKALPLRPGLNPAAVTDTQLAEAVQLVWNPPTEGESA